MYMYQQSVLCTCINFVRKKTTKINIQNSNMQLGIHCVICYCLDCSPLKKYFAMVLILKPCIMSSENGNIGGATFIGFLRKKRKRVNLYSWSSDT